jgi:hypothetical protein
MSSIEFNNLQEYVDYMNNYVLITIVGELAKFAKEVIQVRIDKDIYEFGDEERSYYYDGTLSPTGEFINTPTFTYPIYINGEVTSKVYHDTNKMESNPDTFKHGSNYYEINDIRYMLPELLNENWSGSFFGENEWFHHRPKYFDNAVRQLMYDDELYTLFKKRLERYGLKIVESR